MLSLRVERRTRREQRRTIRRERAAVLSRVQIALEGCDELMNADLDAEQEMADDCLRNAEMIINT